MTTDFSLGYNSNKESNDFLRCFWAALRKEFGKAAWNRMFEYLYITLTRKPQKVM